MRRTNGLKLLRRCGILTAGLALTGTLFGCLVVGVSNRGGWFVWPRGFGLLFIFAMLVILLLRRRR
jgi:hypothetical protein